MQGDVAEGQVYSHAVRNSATALFPVGSTSSVMMTGTAGGITAGGDYQLNWFVVGVTGSWQGTNISGSSTTYSPQIKGDYLVMSRDSDWLADTGGRVGLALDRWLFYGKGGAAAAV
jgi:outer membrane immunogenic protein